MQRTVGTGLGLYVSKLLVEKFGGTIGFTSVQGKGSTFWFELPLAKETVAKPNILV
jgi:signal transduction histidine kinase